MQPFRGQQIVALAAAIHHSREEFDDSVFSIADQRIAQLVIDAAARNIADQLAAVTPKFDRRRFLTDCGCRLLATVS